MTTILIIAQIMIMLVFFYNARKYHRKEYEERSFCLWFYFVFSIIVTAYQLLIHGIGFDKLPIWMKLGNVLLDYVLLGAYVVLNRNKDILISFSKLDQIAFLNTTYHK